MYLYSNERTQTNAKTMIILDAQQKPQQDGFAVARIFEAVKYNKKVLYFGIYTRGNKWKVLLNYSII